MNMQLPAIALESEKFKKVPYITCLLVEKKKPVLSE